MEHALLTENWKEYTTLLHALKSTSLSLGGQGLSDMAKAQELAGRCILSPKSTDGEKRAAMQEIKEHHGKTMQLYDDFAAEAAKKLAGEQKEDIHCKRKDITLGINMHFKKTADFSGG